MRSLFLDLNAYFASVEQAEDPRLRGRPVGVCPVMADSSFIIAASYEAKRWGVRTGTQIGEARLKCPEIVLLPAQPPLYTLYHRRILDAVDTVLPVAQVCSIDEMRFDLLGRERERTVAEGLARGLKAAIRDQVAENLSCSVGIAPNSFLAKIATDLQKPDGLVVLESGGLPGPLEGLELTEFCGINRRMAARLQAQAIFTGRDLVHADRDRLVRAFGGVVGERWWYQLRGYEVNGPETHRKTLGHSHVLPPELRNDEGVRGVLMRLAQKAAARLRANGLVARHLEVGVRGSRQSWSAKTRLPDTHDSVRITSEVAQLFEQRDYSGPRLVSITFSEVVEPIAITPSLFDLAEDQPPSGPALSQALDALNQRFGKNAVYLGAVHHTRDTAAEKIAFQKTELFVEGRGDHEWVNPRNPGTTPTPRDPAT